MDIDIERLNWDAEYWDEVAPEGAELFIDHLYFAKWLNGVEMNFFISDGFWREAGHKYEKARYAKEEKIGFWHVIPRPTKPAAPECVKYPSGRGKLTNRNQLQTSGDTMKLATDKACWLLAAFILFGTLWVDYANAETYVYAGAWSKHIGSDYDYNETHDLLAVQHRDWVAGRFINSYDKETFFAGHQFSKQWGDFEAGVMVGAMRGYNDCIKGYRKGASTKVCPMVVPSLSWTDNTVQPTVMLLGNAVAISIRLEL